MLKSYEAIYAHGQIHWLGEAPPLDRARIIVTVLDETNAPPASRRVPPSALKGSITFHDYNPFEPAMTDEEAEAALDRTARQIAGDADAFRI
ncbi:MAG: hypothetical protein V9H25_04080 [Candidatus Competibacter sp.]